MTQNAVTPKTLLITAVIAFTAALLMVALTDMSALAQGGAIQVWGERNRTNGYRGAEAQIAVPNPNIPNNSWTSGLVGVTNGTTTFIESGGTKACDRDCKLHPYGSWRNANGAGAEFVDTTAVLATNGWYRYYSAIVGTNTWQSVWCSGTGCRGMVTGNLLTENLPTVASGGESSGPNWGTVQTRSNKYTTNTNGIFSWCYTREWVNAPGGDVTNCNSSNYSWNAIKN